MYRGVRKRSKKSRLAELSSRAPPYPTMFLKIQLRLHRGKQKLREREAGWQSGLRNSRAEKMESALELIMNSENRVSLRLKEMAELVGAASGRR